jgi:DNA modification methylase
MTWTLHHGDCIEWMRSLPDKSVDHTITDPPYSEHVQRNLKTNSNGRGRTVKAGFAHMTDARIESVAEQIARLSRRWSLVFSDVESAHLWRQHGERFGLEYIRTVFYRRLRVAPQISGDRPAAACEVATLFHPPGRKRWNGGGRAGFYAASPDDRSDTGHPTAKPLDLMLALVADFTDPGEIVLDPFCGSGTTGLAALRLGRHFLGAEMDATHHATATDRLRAEESGSTLSAVRAGQLALIDDPPAGEAG